MTSMTRLWTKRIRKLQAMLQTSAPPLVVFRYGSVQRLPDDPPGERHVVVTTSEPTVLPNVERCEFQERVGPAPADGELSFNVYLSSEDETGDPP
jgi:hypothetical protein